MLQEILSYINTLDPAVVYLVLFFFAFIENVFPPSPSDLVLVIGATLIAHSPIGFIPILLITSVGSGVGFIVMYYIGEFMGEKLIRKGKLKFLKKESLDKTDGWFSKYGYNLILINRFMPGTRAVISFFCGVHRLKPAKTFLFAALSSFVWNAILISLGIALGNNVELIDKYLGTYSNIGLALTSIVISFILYKIWKKKKTK